MEEFYVTYETQEGPVTKTFATEREAEDFCYLVESEPVGSIN